MVCGMHECTNCSACNGQRTDSFATKDNARHCEVSSLAWRKRVQKFGVRTATRSVDHIEDFLDQIKGKAK